MVRISAAGIALIGLALARAIPSCLSPSPGSFTGYAPLVEVTRGSCPGTDLTWLRWGTGIAGILVACLILTIAARRHRRATSDVEHVQRVAKRGAALALGVFIVALLAALLVPSEPLVPFRVADYGPGIPVPMNHFLLLRLLIAAAGTISALVVASIASLTRRSPTTR
jgi:hypothetical protein